MTKLPSPPFFPKPRVWSPLPGVIDTSEFRSPGDLLHIAEHKAFRSSEAYRWELSEGRKTLHIGGAVALRYAFAHLEQWRGADPARTPCGILEDSPFYTRRGFMLDISRCKVPTRAGLTRWVRLLAAFRFNELQMYTEHSFAYSKHEPVWRHASPLTPEDVRWLAALCREHGIELVPNQNCFGHFERWLRHPEYRGYAEAPDGFRTPWGDWRKEGSVLKPDDASFALVSGLLDELCPLFESAWINIGCDETWELGQGASRERCEKEGVGNVYTDFVLRVMEHARKLGKRPQFWGDILIKFPEQLSRLPKNAFALEWGYEADHPFEKDCRIFGSSGLDFAVCPGTSSWNSFAGRTDNMLANIQSAALCGASNGASGLLLTDWGDNGHLQQEPVSWPALAWGGLLAWNPEQAQVDDAIVWCDKEAFGGEPGACAAWMELGRISERLGWFPSNRNALFSLFQGTQDAERAKIPLPLLEEVLAHLDGLTAPAAERDAWDQCARNLRLALQRELFRRGEIPDVEELEKEACHFHAELWRRWNREGGLAESLSFYTRAAPTAHTPSRSPPMTDHPDMLQDLFDKQMALNQRIGVNPPAMDEAEQAKWVLNYTRAASQELAELIDSVPWKWWAKYQTFDKQNARVEVVDLFHFLISLAQVLGMDAKDVHDLYNQKNKLNFQRQDSGYEKKDENDNKNLGV